MLCSLLALLHTYSVFQSTYRVWGTADRTPVGVSMESNHHRMTIVHNDSYLPCFTNSTLNHTWLSSTLIRYDAPSHDHYVLHNQSHPERAPKCNEEDDDDDDDEIIERKRRHQRWMDFKRKYKKLLHHVRVLTHKRKAKEADEEEKLEHTTKEVKHKAKEVEHETKEVKHKAKEVEHETKEVKHKAKEVEHETKEVKRKASVVPSATRVVPSKARVVPSKARVVPSKARVVPSATRVVPSKARVVPSKAVFTKPTLVLVQHKMKVLSTNAKKINSAISSTTTQLHKVKNPRQLLALVNKLHHLIKAQAATRTQLGKAAIQAFTLRQKNFAKSEDGKEAKDFCKSLGAKGKSMEGCMQDMRLTDNKAIAKASVLVTKKAVQTAVIAKKIQIRTGSAPSRTCSASGDPHFTNFNGEYFHIQEPLIYVFAKSDDGLFEVQVKQDGSTGIGTPSYVRSVVTKYADQIFHSSFQKDGFSVSVGPSYVSVTVPGGYENHMLGICGMNGPTASSQNFKLPSGKLSDVNYGKKNWQLGGYGGPTTKLSKWHLSWRPSLTECLFSASECSSNLKSRAGSRKKFISTPWGVVDMSVL